MCIFVSLVWTTHIMKSFWRETEVSILTTVHINETWKWSKACKYHFASFRPQKCREEKGCSRLPVLAALRAFTRLVVWFSVNKKKLNNSSCIIKKQIAQRSILFFFYRTFLALLRIMYMQRRWMWLKFWVATRVWKRQMLCSLLNQHVWQHNSTLLSTVQFCTIRGVFLFPTYQVLLFSTFVNYLLYACHLLLYKEGWISCYILLLP